MKKLFAVVLFTLICLFVCACNEEPTPKLPEIEGVVFESASFDYDGTEKSLVASNIPEGVNAVYKNNKGTDANTYNASVTLTKEGYETKTLTATLTINKIEITGVTFESANFDYDGSEKELIANNIPEGISASYSGNKGTDAGTYNASVTLSAKNYKEKILSATLTINELEITGVTFESANFDYDGSEKELIANNIPEGISASYSGNKGTDAGTYNASVTLSAKNYKEKTLNATLTINKIEIMGVVFESAQFKYDGEEKSIVATNIPDGVTAVYTNNKGTEPGKYQASVTLSGNNYIEKTLTAELTVKKTLALVIGAFGKVPTPWEFLPAPLNIQNKVVASVPTYTDFVSTSAIPTNYIGKQLNVIYGVLNKTTTALSYVNIVYGSLNIIEQAYNAFIATNPDDATVFENNEGAFTYKLELGENYYTLTANVSGVGVEIFANLDEESYGARIQLSASNVLKYEVDGNKFKVALNILNASSTLVQFEKNETSGIVTGSLYEYLSVAGKELISTSAYLYSDENYTTVIGTKGDFIPTADSRNCEVYDNETGRLVGTEVSEILGEGKATYDTLWYNLCDINGIFSIKKLDEMNGMNADTIYINGKADTIHTKIVALLNPSRRFDIEFKSVCAYTYNAESEEYELVEFEVPMMFIQESVLSDFESDFEEKNDVTVILVKTAEDKAAVHNGYHVLVDFSNTSVMNGVTQKDIQDYCTPPEA